MEAILLFLEITPNVHIILFSSNLLDQVFSKKKNQHGQFKYEKWIQVLSVLWLIYLL